MLPFVLAMALLSVLRFVCLLFRCCFALHGAEDKDDFTRTKTDGRRENGSAHATIVSSDSTTVPLGKKCSNQAETQE